MIGEVKCQQERQKEGIDILQYVESWNLIKFSNNSIFEVEISDFTQFIQNDLDQQFFNELNERNSQSFMSLAFPDGNQKEKQSAQGQKLILKEIFGSDIKYEIELVKQIRKIKYRIPGLIYLINYAIYQTESLEVGYILMEKGDMNLQQFLEERLKQNQPIQYRELVSIMKQSINALAQMQEEKIAHNDIKLANILVFKKPLQNQQNQQSIKSSEQIKQTKNQTSLANQFVFDQSATFSPIKSGRISGQKQTKMAPNKFSFNDYDKNSSYLQEDKEVLQINIQEATAIDYDIDIKFCDIGSSQANQSTFKKTKKPGTDSYLAPEEFSSDKIHIYKYDVYSLGLCFINLIIQKVSNFHIYMKNSNWNQLMTQKDWLNILQDIQDEWIRIAYTRMNNSEELKTILSKMLQIDISTRPDFIELRALFEDLFKNQPIKELMSPNSQSSPNNIEDVCVENQFDISKNDIKEDKKRTQQELKNQRNYDKVTQSQRKLKQSDGKAKLIQLVQSGIGENDSPSQLISQQKQSFGMFNVNSSQEDLIIKNISQQNSFQLSNLHSAESQLQASISPKESEGSPSAIQDIINENQKQQIVAPSISRKQLAANKLNQIQQAQKKMPIKVLESNSITSPNSSSSFPTNLTSNSNSMTNFVSQEQAQLRKKSNTTNDKKKMSTYQNSLANIAESIVISQEVAKQYNNLRQPSQESNNMAISKQQNPNTQSTQLNAGLYQNSPLNNKQNLQNISYPQQSLYFQQNHQIENLDKKMIGSSNFTTADQKLNISQSTRHLQQQAAPKKIDFASNFTTRSQVNMNMNAMSSKITRKSQNEDLENNNNHFIKNNQHSIQKMYADHQNPTSTLTNFQNSALSQNQINSLTNLQFKNPFNQTLTGKASKSFKDLQQGNYIDSPTQNTKQIQDRRQKNTSTSSFKLPPIQNTFYEQDQNILQNLHTEKNEHEGIQKYDKARQFSIQENFSIKQAFDSDQSNPDSPHKYSKSNISKGDLTPQLKQSQMQRSKFSNQKLTKGSSQSQSKFNFMNNGNLTTTNCQSMNLKVSFPTSATNRQQQNQQQYYQINSHQNNNGGQSNNNNNFLSVSSNYLGANNQLKMSQKNLNDYVNENQEQVTISEYSEMLKFYENFIKVSNKNKIQKYLTVCLNGTDNQNIHGIIDCLYKMDGLAYLNLQIIQQKSQVINWALDVIETIGASLVNLNILFKDCDYKNHVKEQSQSDFLKRDQQIKAQEKPLQLIVRLEGKQGDPLEMLDFLISKSSCFQDRITIFNIDIQKKNLDDPTKLINSLKSIQKYKNLDSFGLDVSRNSVSQVDSNNIFLALEQLKHIHTLSFNISQNQPNLFNDSHLVFNLPHSLQILYLNLSYNKVSTTQFVKLQKAIESCTHLNTVYLYLSACVNKENTNQLMLFFTFLLKQVKKVGIFSDSNQLFDEEFKLYKSELLNPFKVEVLTISLNKNILSFETFKVLSQMIKMQQKLKQATIIFPRTILKKQIMDQFTNKDNETYILSLKNDQFDYITIQIDIIKRTLIKKQSNLSIQTGKNASLTFIPLETISSNQCWNISKQSGVFQGFYCLTCYEKCQVKNDSFYCLYCIKNCHQDHRYIEIHDFPSVQLVCSCIEKGSCNGSVKSLSSISNNNQNIIQLSPSKPHQK